MSLNIIRAIRLCLNNYCEKWRCWRLFSPPQAPWRNLRMLFNMDDNFRHGWHEATVGSSCFTSRISSSDVTRPDPYYYVLGYAGGLHGDGARRRGPLPRQLSTGAGRFLAPVFSMGRAIMSLGRRYGSAIIFVQPGWRLVPSLKVAAAGLIIDIPHHYDGKDFNFNLDAASGFRYFITARCSLNVEYRFQHISNAGPLAESNIGVNAGGPSAGVSFFF